MKRGGKGRVIVMDYYIDRNRKQTHYGRSYIIGRMKDLYIMFTYYVDREIREEVEQRKKRQGIYNDISEDKEFPRVTKICDDCWVNKLEKKPEKEGLYWEFSKEI